MRKSHPANALGWLFVEPVQWQRAMYEQLRQRDQQLAEDRNFSGEPPGFHAWALAHIAELAAQDPGIRRQIADRIAHVQQQLDRNQVEREQLITALDHRANRLAAELAELQSLAKVPG